ncbi:hypothetical protein BC827DRAFT_1385125 [Russula dissimulans]|nr:hypothetical protein BC827DRAFT_1385125 [Russula dissimulans]
MARSRSPFTININAAGGGGGGSSPSPGSGASGSGQNNNQVTGSGTTNPRQPSIRREHVNIEIAGGRKYNKQTGHITAIPIMRIPKRLVLTSNSYLYGNITGNNLYTFMIDVLLVPLSFNAEACFDLYLAPFSPGSEPGYMGTRSPRNDIILLRRISVRGELATMKVKQWDVPEDIRNRTEDYRLVVTCPALQTATLSPAAKFALLLQLEMEF